MLKPRRFILLSSKVYRPGANLLQYAVGFHFGHINLSQKTQIITTQPNSKASLALSPRLFLLDARTGKLLIGYEQNLEHCKYNQYFKFSKKFVGFSTLQQLQRRL
jgi:hypothetical protein